MLSFVEEVFDSDTPADVEWPNNFKLFLGRSVSDLYVRDTSFDEKSLRGGDRVEEMHSDPTCFAPVCSPT